MNPSHKNLIALLAGTFGLAACAMALCLVVAYKPWGVPDSRRQEYDAKVAAFRYQRDLKQEYANKPKPTAFVPTTSAKGMFDPQATTSQAFAIHNRGERPLTLALGYATRGCTAELDSETLKPGEEGKLVLSWRTGEPGLSESCSTTLKTNDPLSPKLTFEVTGETRADLVSPERVTFEPSDPAERSDCSFVVYSQIWDDFTVTDIESDLEVFDWHAEPLEVSSEQLMENHARSAWRLRLSTLAFEYGAFAGNINLRVESADDETLTRSITCKGRVRAPIVFHSPEIHVTDGLDIGTVVSGEKHDFHLVVRVRGDIDRKIQVLEVKPDELSASLEPLTINGNYRLTLTVPADCPTLTFNAAQKHGYVLVGDPNERKFSNWFPLNGAVAQLEKH